MKRKYAVIFLFAMLFSLITLTGCKKLVDTQYEKVEVTVVDTYHRGGYMTPIHAGKVTTWVTHPAVYRVYVEYEGAQFTISGSETYNEFKSKIGETVIGTLEIRTYDDGSIEQIITSIEKGKE